MWSAARSNDEMSSTLPNGTAEMNSVYMVQVRHNLSWAAKGQIISKANFLVLIWTKNRTKLFFDFCPNVCHAEKRTKRSSNILLRLVRFSAWQTLGRDSAIQKGKTIRLFSVKIAIVNCQRSAQPPSANAVYLVYRGAIMQKRWL